MIYDLIHVLAEHGREVIDRVRVDEADRLRQDRAARQVVKSSRSLLRKRDNVAAAGAVPLDELLAASRQVMTVYVLGDALEQLWRYRHSGFARRFWHQWYGRAVRSRIPPPVRLASGARENTRVRYGFFRTR